MVHSALIALLFVLTLNGDKHEKSETAIPTASANVGSCGADFHVMETSSDGVADAIISVTIPAEPGKRKTRTLEVRTDKNGRARFQGLSGANPLPLRFTVNYGRGVTTVDVDLRECHGTYDVVLPDRPPQNER
jgi:hypothetical protein